MFENLRKKSIKKVLFVVILLIVVGFLFAVFQIPNLMALMKGHERFESLAPDEIKEKVIVDATIEVNFGAFMEEYEENTKTHVTKTTDMYYVIWTGDEDDMDYRYMAIKVPAYYIDQMDEMADATYNYEYVEPISFSGAIKKMDSQELQYFEEYFLESGFTREELDDYIIPYYIEEGELVGGGAGLVYVLLVFGLILMVIGVCILVSTVKGGSLKALKKELETYGITEDGADMEYENARIYGDVRIGNRLTFYMVGSHPHVILNEKLVWAYQHTTTHRTNGIKTGTTYSVVLSTNEKKSTYVNVANENMALSILQDIKQNIPWVVVGYSDDLKNMYNKDFANFLELLYNKVKSEQQFQNY